MQSLSSVSYRHFAHPLARIMAGFLSALLWLPAQLGFGRQARNTMNRIASAREHWIGPVSGDNPGLVSSYRLHLRMAMALDDEQYWDQHDAQSRSWRFDLALLMRFGWSLLIGHKKPNQLENRWPLLGLWLDNLRHAEIESHIAGWRTQGHLRRIAFVNPHCANVASKDPLYRGVLNSADLLLPDGSGVLLASRLLGTPLQENTNGTDLFPILCQQWQQAGARLYLLGGKEGVAEAVARHLLQKYPGLHIAGTHHGYSSTADTPLLIEDIKQSNADVLVVAMGVPLQDVWIARHQHATGIPLAIGVGGLFDFLSGRIPRAPVWLRELGLEWCWRLLQEPSRMWRRYLVGNFSFLARVLKQKYQRQQASLRLITPSVRTPNLPDQRKQAVVLNDYTLWQGDDPIGTLLAPLVGHSLLELSIIRLVEQGVQLIHVFADQGYSAIVAQLGNGDRWGIEIRYYLTGQHLQTRTRLAALPLPEDIWLLAPGCLPHSILSEAHQCQWRLADGCWSGWAYIKSTRLKLAMDKADLPLPLYDQIFDGFSLRNAHELNVALPLLLSKAPPYIPDYQETQDRVWLASGVICEKGVTLEGPVLIGRNSLIRKGSHIGPHVIIGEGCVLDRQVDVHNSILKPYSYIASQMSLSHCLVGNRQLHLVRDNTILRFKAEECLIDDMNHPVSSPNLMERLHAILALSWLGWQQNSLDHARWQNLADRLHKVIRGECHLIGLPSLPSKMDNTIDRKTLRIGALRLSELQAEMLPAQGLSRAEQDWLTDLYGAAVPQYLSWSKLRHLALSLQQNKHHFAIRT
ncbi:WecB/TagA/CpsF family glycosyltransferase [Chitinibacter bivalviorum]|uniref:WecB/TagA/CpsF family glycosyltransferase n=1 Tax=Chitinibacter bivalviorum TaxID=2739434 RepID=A0A7H9BHH5_9NEIS|nr:WecB/TagA/CpsF family glycosyltransferase [Chitinibacter bivalviorum]QLG87782.1 WecB/TagA/CpsF family glycosyltransferase [Chitinibacter bivalviorum]